MNPPFAGCDFDGVKPKIRHYEIEIVSIGKYQSLEFCDKLRVVS